MKSLFLTAVAIGLAGIAGAESYEFDTARISLVDVRNGSGAIRITAKDSGKATVSVNKHQPFGKDCTVSVSKRGRTLLAAVESSAFSRGNCAADFDLAVPKAVALDLDTGSGDVKVTGTSGDLTFRVGSGTVTVDAEIKKLAGKSGNGDIAIRGLTEGGSVWTGSGNVRLVYGVPPRSGELEIRTGSGGAEVVLPKASHVRTSFIAGSGKLVNEFTDTPNSPFKISMKAGSGDLQVRKQ